MDWSAGRALFLSVASWCEEKVTKCPDLSGQKLEDLIDSYLDGTLDPNEATDLETRFQADREARDVLIRVLTLQGLIEFALKHSSACTNR